MSERLTSIRAALRAQEKAEREDYEREQQVLEDTALDAGKATK